MGDSPGKAVYRHVPIASLHGDELLALSQKLKLSLSREDMLAVQKIFAEEKREPTDVELEVIAQTWSEHCKHRIFGALIEHTVDGKAEIVDGLFQTYIKAVTERIMERKPGFVLSAFKDNAGFVKLDDKLAVCLKAETHNHPSAIEPYAGANTGLGGVIRDILGAGKGAKPIASLDVFCFGPPDTHEADIKAKDVIHPLGIMRGVVRGVRDYGNRMGIPTTSGAIAFDKTYIYNPLVFCGTMGLIPIQDIAKEVKAGHILIAAGGRTGRDGLKGATFSSVSLTTSSHEEDQTAVQIGNPIEEKKVADFILAARDEGLIQFVTDCGAGGFSSAAGEMLSEVGGEIWLENAPLKVAEMESWQIFISESQERMVLAIEEENLPRMRELAATCETELCVLGMADGSGILKVKHHGEEVCRLDCRKLHEAPRRKMKAEWVSIHTTRPARKEPQRVPITSSSDEESAGMWRPRKEDNTPEKVVESFKGYLDGRRQKLAREGKLTPELKAKSDSVLREMTESINSMSEDVFRHLVNSEERRVSDAGSCLRKLLGDFAIVSREPIIREYDHEVQGNTMLKPLAGASGDAPQDGSVIRIDGSNKLVALATALLPEWGKTNPHLMGRATVDECVRQLVAMGANPEKIAILDNFCVGNPDDVRELGALVETTKGMAQAAEIYGTPFVSGKDSFYNYFKTDDGPVSIPCTLLVSGFGIIEEVRHVIGASLRGAGNKLCMLGRTCNGSLGSVQLRCSSAMVDGKLRTIEFSQDLDESKALGDYGRYHQLVKRGFVLSAHDVGEGGLAVALAEMGFTNNAGIKADLQKCPNDIGHDPGGMNFLFVETPARVIFEVAPENAHLAEELGFPVVGETTNDGRLVITDGETRLIDEPLSELKLLWKNGLVPYY